MPLYLVRWPNLSCCLLTADDEEDLIYHLDELADPSGCTWTVYRGPVWIEFDLPVKYRDTRDEDTEWTTPLQANQLEVTDVEKLVETQRLVPSLPDCDTEFEMREEIMRFAFPSLAHVLFDEDWGEAPSEKKIRAAVRKDLVGPMTRASWRVHQTRKRNNLESRIAASMGTSPEVVRQMVRQRPVEPQRKASSRKPRKKK